MTVRPLQLTCVGDITLGDHPKAIGFGFQSRYGPVPPSGFAERLRFPGPAPDLYFANLEFPLGMTPDTTSVAERECNGWPTFAAALAKAGIGAVNVATNHSYQHGRAAFERTVTAIREAGIRPVGTPADFDAESIQEVAGRRVALLGWCDRPRQYSPESPPYNEWGEWAFDAVADARRRADVVLVSLHWGDEFILVPPEEHRVLARRLIDAGATVIVGHHPHVVREIEHYRHGVIAYSLGNFVCDMTWDLRTRMSAWLSVTIDAAGAAAGTLVPAIIADDYLPRALGPEHRRHAARIESARSAEATRVARTGYAEVSARAHRRHALRTALQMVRNWRKFPPGLIFGLFAAALRNRSPFRNRP